MCRSKCQLKLERVAVDTEAISFNGLDDPFFSLLLLNCEFFGLEFHLKSYQALGCSFAEKVNRLVAF